MDTNKIAEALLDEAREILEESLEEDGGPVRSGPVEILVGSNWNPTTAEVFRAWTGRRRVWGIEYHGPVFPLGKEESGPYVGARVCPCSKCQEHVVPQLRYN